MTEQPAKSMEPGPCDALAFENEMLTRGGIIEVAVRNPNVAEYMRHWEGRAEAATALITQLADALREANAFILAPAEDIKEGVLSRIRAALRLGRG